MSTSSSHNAWNLDRLLVVLSAGFVLLAGLAESGWNLTRFVGFLPMMAPGLPGLLFALVLAYYARPWVYLTAGLLNMVLPLMVLFLFGEIQSITNIAKGTSYQSLVLLVLALGFALTGGVGGFVRSRKGAHAPLQGALATRQGLAVAMAAMVVLGLFLAGGMATASVKSFATGGGYDVAPDETVTLIMKDHAFSPRELRVPAGKLVEIVIVNEDATLHTLTYEANGKTFSENVLGDTETRVLVRFDAPQTVPFWCVPHSEGAGDTNPENMLGAIIVE